MEPPWFSAGCRTPVPCFRRLISVRSVVQIYPGPCDPVRSVTGQGLSFLTLPTSRAPPGDSVVHPEPRSGGEERGSAGAAKRPQGTSVSPQLKSTQAHWWEARCPAGLFEGPSGNAFWFFGRWCQFAVPVGSGTAHGAEGAPVSRATHIVSGSRTPHLSLFIVLHILVIVEYNDYYI